MTTVELRRVAAARRRRDKADADLRSAIDAARTAGATMPEIAAAAGVSKQRVAQILKEGDRACA